MGGIASPGQLRVAYARWALVTVPVVVLLGMLSGVMGNAGIANGWYARLDKPALMPPGWFWTIPYILMGFALAIVLNARGARNRRLAITIFAIQFVLYLAWSPLFFGYHQIVAALVSIVLILVLAAVMTVLFWRIRAVAGALIVPYMLWLAFVSVVTWQIHALNPNAESLVPRGGDTQIAL